jgi:hypothetical protein
LLDNLTGQQFEDGSWGSQAFSPSDRLLNTMAAISALEYNRQRWDEFRKYNSFHPNFPPCYRQCLELGLAWLKKNGNSQFLKEDEADLAGMELILTALRLELEELGLQDNTLSEPDELTSKAIRKLNMVPPGLIFKPGSTLSHALEFTGQLMETGADNFASSVLGNGSVGSSPSATAFTLKHTWHSLDPHERDRMSGYLTDSVLVTSHPTHPERVGWPVTYPMNYFLEVWYKYYLKQFLLPYRKRVLEGGGD